MVWVRELIRLQRSKVRIFFGFAQPVGFLLVIGIGLSPLVGSTRLPEHVSYREFIFPGILAMSTIMSALYSTVSIVLDREYGFMREMLVAPVSRTSIILGKLLGGASIAIVQGMVLLALAPAVGVHLTVASVFELFAALLLLAFSVTALGIVLSATMQRTESLQVVMTLVMQPMIFTSGAIFPITNLPTWLTVVCRLNPATYGVDLGRRAVLGSGFALTFGDWVVPVLLDVAIVLTFGTAMLALATRRFTRTA
jgi:ABC-2 type transport system permease protein